MANTTLAGATLHDGSNSIIIENTCRKESMLTILGLYLSDSDATDVYDYGGTTKIITLTGVYIGANIAALKTWVDDVESLIQGHQDRQAGYPIAFIDDLRGSLYVKVLSFDSTFNQGTTTKIEWTIKLVQSSTNA